MRALVTLTCGTLGAYLITAAGITTIIFTVMGGAPDLILGALMLSGWAMLFGVMFIITAILGHATGVLEAKDSGGTDA